MLCREQDFRTAQRLIRQIADMAKAMLSQSQSRSSSSGSETKRLNLILIANVQSGLAAKVQELSGVFRTKQTSYLRREFQQDLLMNETMY
jgi:syntaxin 16